MVKIDMGQIIASKSIRKIIVDLINENNYSEETEEELNIPKKTNFTFYKRRYLTEQIGKPLK